MNRSDLLESVAEMNFRDLRELDELIEVRRKRLMDTLTEGQRVKVAGLRKTNEWRGEHEGTIKNIKRTKMVVSIPHPINGHTVNWNLTPHAIAEVLD